MRRARWLIALAALGAGGAAASAAAPLLRFTFDSDEAYNIVSAYGRHGEHVATINEIHVSNPVIYPAPDMDNAIIAGDLLEQEYVPMHPPVYDGMIYVRLRRTAARRWAVLECTATGFYRVQINSSADERGVGRVARAALVALVKHGKPVPGEQCKPAREIQKGSRTY